MSEKKLWYKDAVIYQLHVKTFYDSDGDGIGDFKGLTEKLDYLKKLGITAIWLLPFYPSPLKDDGYDIADYCGIDPAFGDFEHFTRLLRVAHRHKIKVILDLVPNHTSDRHPWFIESRSSRDNPKRDWYLWREPRADGTAPNNWMSEFGGSAWSYDAGTKQYYYHAFLREQPDLNWRNPAVRQASTTLCVSGCNVVSTVFASMCSGI